MAPANKSHETGHETPRAIGSLLWQPHLSLITRGGDAFLARIQDVVDHVMPVGGREDVWEVFERLATAVVVSGRTPRRKTLDLIGHSTPGDSLLRLGDWVIDARIASVRDAFTELASLLPTLGVHTIRLLGCNTADMPAGRETIAALAEILDLEVYGTAGPVMSAQFDAAGFNPDWRFVLVSNTELRWKAMPVVGSAPPPVLAIAVVPVSALEQTDWERRLASVDDLDRIFPLVRCTEGAPMPGHVLPSCELVVPASEPDAWRAMQLLFDATFVRIFPDGPDRPGVVYPVADPDGLRSIVASLPTLNIDAPIAELH